MMWIWMIVLGIAIKATSYYVREDSRRIRERRRMMIVYEREQGHADGAL